MAIDAKIGFAAIARPTFDTELAQAQTQITLKSLKDANIAYYGTGSLIMSDADVEAAIQQLEARQLDMLLVLQASFADSTMVKRMAEALDVPLLLWALPEERVGGRLRLNSFCGINLAGHSLKRDGYHYDYIYAAPDSDEAIEKLRTFATAAAVKNRLQSARIGRVGENPAGFETCLFDAEMLKSRVGVEVVQLELETVFEGARAAEPAKVAEVEAGLRGQLSGLDDVDADEARLTMSTYVTMDDLAATQQLDGMAVRCWPEFFTDLGCSACGAMSMMSDSMRPTSCEADVNGTITQLMLQWVSSGVAFGTDIVSFDVDDNSVVVWHCGLAPLSMADPAFTPQAALHSNRQKPLLMEFPLKPGRVTIARLSEAAGTLKLVIGGGEMLRRPPAFTGTSGVIRFDNGAQSVMDTIMNAGLEHHIALTYGDHVDVLIALSNMLNIPVLRL